MPGLTFYLNHQNLKKDNLDSKLLKLKNTFKVPTLNYCEEHIIGDSFLAYSCVPEFINESKIQKIKNYIIAIDGNFYNQNDLADILKIWNISKLEIIYHLFKKFGKDFANLLEGTFNIVIYDTMNMSLLITNDRFARKPFFYSRIENEIIFSSEKKGILSIFEKNRSLETLGLLEVFSLNHNLNGRTFLKNVFVSKPAEVIFSTKNKFQTSKYSQWDFSKITQNIHNENHLDSLYTALSDSVNNKIQNLDKIIIWLSGGYDSRAIAAMIDEKHRHKFTAITFGEDNSPELSIAKEVSNRLSYDWFHQKVNDDYLNIAELNSWRAEFAITGMEHPFISNHQSMKKMGDYILSGLPGLDTLNGSIMSLGKIIRSYLPNFHEAIFVGYSQSESKLSTIFNQELLKEFLPILKNNFISIIDDRIEKKIYQWQYFNLTQRQPYYSNMSNLIDNDLFETISPFADVSLASIYFSLPLRNKLFMQSTKNMMYKYFPELRNIPFDNNRGLLRKRNNLLNTTLYEITHMIRKKSKSVIWDKNKAMLNNKVEIKEFINSMFENYHGLTDYFNLNNILKLFTTDEKLVINSRLIDSLITFLFTYKNLVHTKDLRPIAPIISNYNSSD